MIRVLHVVSGLGSGGVESMLYNYYLHLDRTKVQFDFIVHESERGLLETKFQFLGSNIYRVSSKKDSLKKNILQIYKVIREGNYNIVHCHQNFLNFISLFLAKKCRIPVRISHAHGYIKDIKMNEKVKNHIRRYLNNYFTNYMFSCSTASGKWLHGERWIVNQENILMKNAIDVDKFLFDNTVRKKYRTSFNFDDKIVLLHVGRFSEEKNHFFMVDIIERLLKKANHYILLFVGDGKTKSKVEEYTREKKLNECIMFLGERDDISELMNAADILLFPSKNEGLGMATIEGQATGLKVLASNKIPSETNITPNISYIPLDGPAEWANKIRTIELSGRESQKELLIKAGYSIKEQVKHYEQWLLKLFP